MWIYFFFAYLWKHVDNILAYYKAIESMRLNSISVAYD